MHPPHHPPHPIIHPVIHPIIHLPSPCAGHLVISYHIYNQDPPKDPLACLQIRSRQDWVPPASGGADLAAETRPKLEEPDLVDLVDLPVPGEHVGAHVWMLLLILAHVSSSFSCWLFVHSPGTSEYFSSQAASPWMTIRSRSSSIARFVFPIYHQNELQGVRQPLARLKWIGLRVDGAIPKFGLHPRHLGGITWGVPSSL